MFRYCADVLCTLVQLWHYDIMLLAGKAVAALSPSFIKPTSPWRLWQACDNPVDMSTALPTSCHERDMGKYGEVHDFTVSERCDIVDVVCVPDTARSSVPALEMSNHPHGREAWEHSHVCQRGRGSSNGRWSRRMAEARAEKPANICRSAWHSDCCI